MIKPMLCKLQGKPFNDERYIWEIKFDGIRGLAKTEVGEYALQSRSGSDKTDTFPELDIRTKVPSILDGELVCYAPDGSQQFNLIQHRMNRIHNIEQSVEEYPSTYEVFDILEMDGKSLMHIPLIQRKEILQSVLFPTHNVNIAKFTDDGIGLFQEVKKVVTGTERGVVGKPKAGLYLPNNRGQWVKVKAWEVDTFVVCGFTAGTGWRSPTFGSMVLAMRMLDGFRYVGMVGTGFTSKEKLLGNDRLISKLYHQMQSLISEDCPMVGWDNSEPVTWIKPEMEVAIQYLEYTNDGMLRFPSIK